MDYSLLLSDEEYQKKFKNGHKTPYTYEIARKGQSIFYFGAEHSRDPGITQWKELERYWNQFLKSTLENRIVLLEGPERPPLRDLTQEEVIKQFGEVGLMMLFANKEGVQISWPDFSMQQEAEQLAKQFDADLVTYFIFARSAGAWLRLDTGETFEAVINKAMINTARRIGRAPHSIEFYANIHRQVFSRDLSASEKETLMRAAAPIYHDSVINEIARTSTRLRNEHIASEIEKCWQDGKSVFAVFGSSHAVIQEKALKSLLES